MDTILIHINIIYKNKYYERQITILLDEIEFNYYLLVELHKY